MKKWVLNNLGLKIFSIFLAAGLWFYINGEITKVVVQKTFDNVRIRITADREKLLLANYQLKISPQTTTVLLRGEKNQIERIRESDLKVLVDISDVSGEGIYNLPIRILLPENIEAVAKAANPSSCQVIIRGFEALSK